MKIRVHCIGILDKGYEPRAVIVSDVRDGRGQTATTVRYVLLSYDERMELTHVTDRGYRKPASRDYSAVFATSFADAFPRLVRAYAWNVEGDLAYGVSPWDRLRIGSWHSAETLWVRADLASAILGDLAEWRQTNPGHFAPNWHALSAAQALALAAGLPLPHATDGETATAPGAQS